MRSTVVITVFAAAAIAILGAAPAEGAKVKTEVRISTFNYGNPSFLIGEVVSAKTKCAKKRDVTLFRVRGGDKQRVGSAKTFSGEGTWAWIINAPDHSPGDAYYAKVDKTKSCRGDKSPEYAPAL